MSTDYSTVASFGIAVLAVLVILPIGLWLKRYFTDGERR